MAIQLAQGNSERGLYIQGFRWTSQDNVLRIC